MWKGLILIKKCCSISPPQYIVLASDVQYKFRCSTIDEMLVNSSIIVYSYLRFYLYSANSSAMPSPSERILDPRDVISARSEFEKNVLHRMGSVFLERNESITIDQDSNPLSETNATTSNQRASYTPYNDRKLPASRRSTFCHQAVRPVGKQAQRKNSSPRFGGVWLHQNLLPFFAIFCLTLSQRQIQQPFNVVDFLVGKFFLFF